jgi:hypothetical protein
MEYFNKDRLKNNVSYFGIHEDTAVAKWDAEEGCFWYISLHKVIGRHPTLISLLHPDDGGSFKPIAELFGHGDINATMSGTGT